MLRSVKQLYGDRLVATDGELGFVKDFYFDDRDWVVRYLIADTGSWLTERKVLIAPHSLGLLERSGRHLAVRLTRRQIAESPSIDQHKPVSRQYEEAYYRYYDLPFYWQGDALWGMSGLPLFSTPSLDQDPSYVALRNATGPDAHLRSAEAVNGYRVKSKDGIFGYVVDFLIDDRDWSIRQIVIQTNEIFSCRQILIPNSQVGRINYEDATVEIELSNAQIHHCPDHHLEPDGSVSLSHAGGTSSAVRSAIRADQIRPGSPVIPWAGTTARSDQHSSVSDVAMPAVAKPTVTARPTVTVAKPTVAVAKPAVAVAVARPAVARSAVARSAYLAFVNQGSQHGHDVQHWLEAEKNLRARPRP